MIVTAYLCATVAMCDTTPTRIYVIDGDTVSINQERIRLDGIDAPELKGKCTNERELARKAHHRLAELIDGSRLVVSRTPVGARKGEFGMEQQFKTDRYGRTLAPLIADGHDVGEAILREGLARKWTKKWDGREEPWCQGKQSMTGQIDGQKVLGLLLRLATN
ncbi:thermonuclease family protein [Agrobacterium rubi]|nr:thermonuclease family protein [Agrobacterium rubi]NTF25189.1 thermonuclease family protein [Agrobacterium rubi]